MSGIDPRSSILTRQYFELVELSQLATQRIFAFVRKSVETRYGSSAAIKKET